MSKKLYLDDRQVRRYKGVDKVVVAKAVGCSPKWARDVLGGRELITGNAARACIEAAELQLKSMTP